MVDLYPVVGTRADGSAGSSANACSRGAAAHPPTTVTKASRTETLAMTRRPDLVRFIDPARTAVCCASITTPYNSTEKTAGCEQPPRLKQVKSQEPAACRDVRELLPRARRRSSKAPRTGGLRARDHRLGRPPRQARKTARSTFLSPYRRYPAHRPQARRHCRGCEPSHRHARGCSPCRGYLWRGNGPRNRQTPALRSGRQGKTRRTRPKRPPPRPASFSLPHSAFPQPSINPSCLATGA